jgi:ABC-2 type transport system permease protein
MSLRRSLAVARNEVRVLRRDPAPLVVLLVMPLFLAPLFSRTYRAVLVLGGHPGASGADYTVPAQMVEFAFFLAPYTGYLFFRDHGWRTWSRLRASPATSADIVIGKAIPMVGLGMAQIAILLAFGAVTLHLHLRGEALALGGVAFVYVCCAVAAGIALTAMLRTSQQLNALGFLGATLLGALGGALVPLSTMPAWARSIAPITPQYWTMQASRDLILNGKPAGTVVIPMLVLVGFTAAFVAIAIRRLRVDEPKVGWA